MRLSPLVTESNLLIELAFFVHVTDAKPGLLVTLSCHIEEEGIKFSSLGHYVVSDKGEVLTETALCHGGGFFKGVCPSGLFHTLRQNPAQPNPGRLIRRNADLPVVFEIRVFPGHLDWPQVLSVQPEATIILPRVFTGDLSGYAPVVRRPVRDGRVRGTLFLPAGVADRPHLPPVIDIYGSAGNIIEHRAALLALTGGMAVLSLPFFGYEDLPPELTAIDMSYFAEAVTFLTTKVPELGQRASVRLLGLSKGSEVALLMSLYPGKLPNQPLVESVVCINPTPYPCKVDIVEGSKLLHTAVRQDFSRAENSEHGTVLKHVYQPPVTSDNTFPVELADPRTRFLFISSLDDLLVPPETADALVARLAKFGRGGQVAELVRYEGAGHVLEPPILPFCGTAYHPPTKAYYAMGGRAESHEKAQLDMWRKVVDFLTARTSFL